MTATLVEQIADGIFGHIRDNELPSGHHLGAQELANKFRVSREPVIAALRALAKANVVYSEFNRGFFVSEPIGASAGTAPPLPDAPDGEDQVYLKIADDRLAGRLPEIVSENELMRRYGIARRRLQHLLAQIVEEGWIERRPGRGWQFGSTLSTGEAYAQAYNFRATIESEALLQPGFKIDESELTALRSQQIALLDGEIFTATGARLFAINSNLHETIVGWSRNRLFIDAIHRVNRLRRLVEYRVNADRARLIKQCHEHLEVLTLIEQGNLAEASAFMRGHVGRAWSGKERAAAAALQQ
jgi:DNA-binding GntR family transcriptional regulator